MIYVNSNDIDALSQLYITKTEVAFDDIPEAFKEEFQKYFFWKNSYVKG